MRESDNKNPKNDTNNSKQDAKRQKNNQTVTLTLFHSKHPQTKVYRLQPDDSIEKKASPQMYSGTARRVTVDFNGFVELFESADSNTSLSFGIYGDAYPDQVSITTVEKENPAKNVLSRSKKNLFFSEGTGVMLNDLDNSPYGRPVSISDFGRIWKKIDPNCVNLTHLIRGSVSSGVRKKGEKSPFHDNRHLYVWVKDASDIPRYAKVLAARLWLAGYGFYALSSSGSLLDRTIIDTSVFSPEHLDFIGSPILSEGLEYTPPQITCSQGNLLDTRLLGDLTPEEQNQLAEIKAAAAASMLDESLAKRAIWEQDKIAELVARGETLDVAQTTIFSMGAGDITELFDAFPLHFADKKLGTATVSEVLANVGLYDGKALADPLRGTEHGTTTAMFFANVDKGKGVPCINSNSRGGCTYFLKLSGLGVQPKLPGAKSKAAEFKKYQAAVGSIEPEKAQDIDNPEPKSGWIESEPKTKTDWQKREDAKKKPELKTREKLTASNGDEQADTVKAPDYLVNDILTKNSNGIVGGAAMTFKTFAMLALAQSICTGKDFFGHRVFKTGKVLYVCGEGRAALFRRIKALKITGGNFSNNLFVLDQHLRLDDQASMDDLRQFVLELKPALIIFDTFASLVTDTDENSNGDVGKVLRFIKEACIEGETSTITVHHYGKDSSKGLRGASGFLGNVDFTWEMTRVPDTKLAMLHCVKNKDDDNFEDIMMRAHVVDLGIVRMDGTPTTSLVMKPTIEKMEVKSLKLGIRETNILAALFRSIDENGIYPPAEIVELYKGNHQKCPQKVEHFDKFRLVAYKFLNMEKSSKRSALSRCLDKLESLEKVILYGGYIWIPS